MNSNDIKISVIVPVFNAEKTLNRCIDSVLNQSFTEFELILVNDGSSDSSKYICANYVQQDERVRLINQINQGVSSARNTGIDAARGQYILFLDSDDVFLSHAFEALYKKAEADHADIVFSDIEKYISESNQERLSPRAGKDFWNNICTHSEEYGYLLGKLLSEKIIKNNRLNTNMKSQEDLNFCIQLYKNTANIVDIPQVTYRYYYTESNRVPKLYDYLRNQMMLYEAAEQRVTLSKEALEQIQSRIESLVLGILYAAETRMETYESVTNIHSILTREYTINTPFLKRMCRYCVLNKKRKIFIYLFFRKRAGKVKKWLKG